MAVLDFILSAACLLLWLNWRSRGLTAPGRASGIALISTLRRTRSSPGERWLSPLVLLAILFGRAILYAQVGTTSKWMPRLTLEPIVLHFRSDLFSRMLLFSLLGFLLWLAGCYFSLLLLAAVNRRASAKDSWLALVHALLGFAAKFPAWVQLLLPAAIAFVFWMVVGPLLSVMQVQLPANSFRHLAGQAFVIALGAWLLWQYVVAGILVLHIVSSYVYFGNAPFWIFIGVTARNLLRPLACVPFAAGQN